MTNQPFYFIMVLTMKVLNKRTDKIPPDAVYVGRPSKWGNIYKLGIDGAREEVILMYREWLEMMLSEGRIEIDSLRGKDLVCWCAPLPCHADVLIELANRK